MTNYHIKFKTREISSHVSMSINPSEFVAFVGGSGAGKSTFMAMVATLIKPTSGDILYNGESIVRKPSVIRGKIGYNLEMLREHICKN